jgi:hypothetical protein
VPDAGFTSGPGDDDVAISTLGGSLLSNRGRHIAGPGYRCHHFAQSLRAVGFDEPGSTYGAWIEGPEAVGLPGASG